MSPLPSRVSLRLLEITLPEDPKVFDAVLENLTHIFTKRREDPVRRLPKEVHEGLACSVVVNGVESPCRPAPLRLFERDFLALTVVGPEVTRMFLVERVVHANQPTKWELAGEYLLEDRLGNLYEHRQKNPAQLISMMFGI